MPLATSSRFCWVKSGTATACSRSWRSQAASREQRVLPVAVALAGGVASNSGLRNTMNDKCQKAGVRLVMPPPILCTDNAAMIGSAAFYRLMRGETAGLDLNACPSLRLV